MPQTDPYDLLEVGFLKNSGYSLQKMHDVVNFAAQTQTIRVHEQLYKLYKSPPADFKEQQANLNKQLEDIKKAAIAVKEAEEEKILQTSNQQKNDSRQTELNKLKEKLDNEINLKNEELRKQGQKPISIKTRIENKNGKLKLVVGTKKNDQHSKQQYQDIKAKLRSEKTAKNSSSMQQKNIAKQTLPAPNNFAHSSHLAFNHFKENPNIKINYTRLNVNDLKKKFEKAAIAKGIKIDAKIIDKKGIPTLLVDMPKNASPEDRKKFEEIKQQFKQDGKKGEKPYVFEDPKACAKAANEMAQARQQQQKAAMQQQKQSPQKINPPKSQSHPPQFKR